MAAVAASAAALAAFTGAGADRTDSSGADALRDADPLRDLADGCLDGLAEVARLEARTAALKVQLAADYARAARFLAPPAASPQERTAQDMAVTAEVACVLTVSERTAGALLSDSRALTTALPLTLAALQAGTISWQHARILVDETSRPGPRRGGRAGGALPGPRRTQPRPRLPGRGPRSVPVPGQGTRLAGTPPPGQHRGPPHHEAPRTGGSSSSRTGTAWPGSRRTCRPTPPRGSGHGPPPPPAPSRARTRPGPWPSSAPTSPPPGSSPAAPPAPATGGMADCGPADGGTGWPGRCGGVPSPRAQVLVTVPVLSLLGATDEPAVLDGYGPIPPSMARRLITDGADSFHRVLTDPRDGAPAGNRTDQLPSHEGPASLAPAPRRQVPVPRLQQPLPGQRGRPPPGLGRRRHHRHLQPGPALPQAPPAETRLRLDTQPGPAGTTRRAGPHRQDGTTRANSRTGNRPIGRTTSRPRTQPGQGTGPRPARGSGTSSGPGAHRVPRPGTRTADPEPEQPPDPFPDWHQFTAAHQFLAADTDDPWLAGAPRRPLPRNASCCYACDRLGDRPLGSGWAERYRIASGVAKPDAALRFQGCPVGAAAATWRRRPEGP